MFQEQLSCAEVSLPRVPPLDPYRGSVLPPCCPPSPGLSEGPQAQPTFYQVPTTPSEHFRPAPSLFPRPAAEPIISSRPGKPELSLPVSRLCDSLAEEKREEEGPEAEEEEEERGPVPVLLELKPEVTEVKVAPGSGLLLSDDNNNNEAGVGAAEAQQPPRPRTATTPSSAGVQESHKCEQCEKTFVTRASLKVRLSSLKFTFFGQWLVLSILLSNFKSLTRDRRVTALNGT